MKLHMLFSFLRPCFAFPFLLLLVFFCPGGVATGINAFNVVVVKERAAETLRTAPEGVLLQIPPYFVRLSSNWTVVERSVGRDGSPGEHGAEEEEGRLLHCRLPIPQTAEIIARLEERYVRHHGPRVRKAVWRWLLDATKGSGCIFGSGEGSVKGEFEWYLFCPRGKLLKVNQTALLARYNIAASELPMKVEELMRRLGDDGGWRDSSFNDWTSVIGEYSKHVTQPRWNVERQTWELRYHTSRACDAGQVNMSFQEGLEEHDEIETPMRGKNTWETIVRFYCGEEQRGQLVHHWSVAELHQVCLHEISLLSPAVCEWDRGIENLRVNPIPCIAI